MATCSSNLDGKANVGPGGGGGGPDTYTAPNEYFVDPGLGADATKRQYQTIDAALAAGTSASDDPIVIRLAEGSDHDWNGSNLAAAGVDVYIYAANPSTDTRIDFQNPTVLSLDGKLSIRNVRFTGTSNTTVGVSSLALDHCSGFWYATVVDPPSPVFSGWDFRYCDLTCEMVVDAGLTSGGLR